MNRHNPSHLRGLARSIILLLLLPLSLSAEEIEVEASANWGVVPLPLIAYTPDTGGMFGVAAIFFFGPDVGLPEEQRTGRRNNVAAVNGIVTTNGSFIAAGNLTMYLREESYRWDTSLAAVRAPGLFFGLGPDADEVETYTARTLGGESSVRRQIAPDLFVGPVYQFEDVVLEETEDDGILALGEVDGTARRSQRSGVGFSAIRDTTGGVFWPESGSTAEGDVRFFGRSLGSAEEFGLYRLRYVVYIPVVPSRESGNAAHVLALQGRFRGSWGDVPFQHLPSLGGDGVMRGVLDGRWRDTVAAIGQVEYRLPLSSRFAVTGFASLGQVADRVTSFSPEKIEGAAGIGFRIALNKEQRLNLRIDLAFSPSGMAPYLGMGEAF